MKAEELIIHTENIAMTTELSLMNQMPVKTLKIYLRSLRKKLQFMHQHEHKWEYMNDGTNYVFFYVDSCDVQLNKEAYCKFLHMLKWWSFRPPKPEWSIITLLLWFHCLPHSEPCFEKPDYNSENSIIFELYEYPCIFQYLYKEHHCSSGLLVCASSSFLLYNL